MFRNDSLPISPEENKKGRWEQGGRDKRVFAHTFCISCQNFMDKNSKLSSGTAPYWIRGVLSPVSFGTVADDRVCIKDLYGSLQEERTESQYNNTAQCSTVQYAILHVTVLVLCGIVQRRVRRI